jgi:hypothetical protein
MTVEEMITWIDNASYYDLTKKWRFAKTDDPLFIGEVGDHYINVMERKKKELAPEETAKISKEIGW